ncbi:unnamed protein product [Durusdinium trenchii]|uniref:Autophagy-related protein 9 n=2 Tax=Durusdinium trenchii TaxID=1381693 RepID=A0ABP0HAH4_9DINO
MDRVAQLEATVARLEKENRQVLQRLELLQDELRGGRGGSPRRTALGPVAGQARTQESLESSSSTESEEDLVVQKSNTEHPVDTKEGYVFAENCWDAVICFGHPSIGWGSSMILLFLLAFTVFLQLVFCYMVYTSFTENPFETGAVTALRYWRIDIAHQASQTSRNSMASLAARTCEFDKSLASSFSEKDKADDR